MKMTPDRRPMYMFTNATGDTSDPSRLGRNMYYLQLGPRAWLKKELDYAVANGFQRAILHMPQSQPRDTPQLYGCSCWLTLEPEFRAAITELIRLYPTLKVGLYTGIMTTTGPDSLDTANSKCLNMGVQPNRALWAASIRPWADAGIQEVWFDQGASYISELNDLKWTHEIFNIRVGGEAMPLSDLGLGKGPGGRWYVLNTVRAAATPFLATVQFLQAWDVEDKHWKCNAQTELHAIYMDQVFPDTASAMAWIKDVRSRGFIVGALGAVADPVVLKEILL